jgi:hypothetical protein
MDTKARALKTHMKFNFSPIVSVVVKIEGVAGEVRWHGGSGGDGLSVTILDEVSVEFLCVAQDFGGHDRRVAAQRLIVGRRGLHGTSNYEAHVGPRLAQHCCDLFGAHAAQVDLPYLQDVVSALQSCILKHDICIYLKVFPPARDKIIPP